MIRNTDIWEYANVTAKNENMKEPLNDEYKPHLGGC